MRKQIGKFNLDKSLKNTVQALPTAQQLKELLKETESSDTRVLLSALFDSNTFIELGTFTKRKFDELLSSDKGDALEGVICGYGAINGRLVFAFAQDASRKNGAIDENHAKKICALYDMAIKNSAPVIGIFNSCGADIFEGAAALAAYGKIMKAVSSASGIIPQISIVNGPCLGLFSAVAATFDFVIKVDNAPFYVVSPELNKEQKKPASISTVCDSSASAAAYVRRLIDFIPDNASNGILSADCADALDREISPALTQEVHALIASIADSGDALQVYDALATETVTYFATVGGVKCGILATDYSVNEGRLSSKGAKKAASFVSFCDAYSIPLITLVNSLGLSVNERCSCFTSELAKLSIAYAQSENAKITVILDRAIGAAFSLLGSKALGADVAYALETSEISALSSDASVAFAWNDKVSLETSRESLVEEWKNSLASPVAAASIGELDDIISAEEIRARICTSLFMLSNKGKKVNGKHTVMPL